MNVPIKEINERLERSEKTPIESEEKWYRTNKFCDWLFNERNSNSTVLAHNGAGYDNKFILQYCLSKGIVPSAFIRQGSRIT